LLFTDCFDIDLRLFQLIKLIFLIKWDNYENGFKSTYNIPRLKTLFILNPQKYVQPVISNAHYYIFERPYQIVRQIFHTPIGYGIQGGFLSRPMQYFCSMIFSPFVDLLNPIYFVFTQIYHYRVTMTISNLVSVLIL
jgi:hypothetical protein